jgi:hypothetical protein
LKHRSWLIEFGTLVSPDPESFAFFAVLSVFAMRILHAKTQRTAKHAKSKPPDHEHTTGSFDHRDFNKTSTPMTAIRSSTKKKIFQTLYGRSPCTSPVRALTMIWYTFWLKR